MNYTHPEYGGAHAAFLVHTEANALLMRGTEGEPVADPRRHPRFEVYLHGQHRPDLSQAAQEGPLTQLPDLPRAFDAATTANATHFMPRGPDPDPRAAGATGATPGGGGEGLASLTAAKADPARRPAKAGNGGVLADFSPPAGGGEPSARGRPRGQAFENFVSK